MAPGRGCRHQNLGSWELECGRISGREEAADSPVLRQSKARGRPGEAEAAALIGGNGAALGAAPGVPPGGWPGGFPAPSGVPSSLPTTSATSTRSLNHSQARLSVLFLSSARIERFQKDHILNLSSKLYRVKTLECIIQCIEI